MKNGSPLFKILYNAKGFPCFPPHFLFPQQTKIVNQHYSKHCFGLWFWLCHVQTRVSDPARPPPQAPPVLPFLGFRQTLFGRPNWTRGKNCFFFLRKQAFFPSKLKNGDELFTTVSLHRHILQISIIFNWRTNYLQYEALWIHTNIAVREGLNRFFFIAKRELGSKSPQKVTELSKVHFVFFNPPKRVQKRSTAEE